MKVIFMGTPDFAVPTLEKLIIDPDIEIIAAYTKEPKIAGRGHKIQNSPIHNLALEHNLPIFHPKTLKSDEEKQKFIALKADFAVVVAYGLILPQEIIDGISVQPIETDYYKFVPGESRQQSKILFGTDYERQI